MYKFVPNNCLCCMQKRQSQTKYYSAIRYEKFGIEYQGFLLHFCTQRNEFNCVLGSKQCVNTQYAALSGAMCNYNENLKLYTLKSLVVQQIVLEILIDSSLSQHHYHPTTIQTYMDESSVFLKDLGLHVRKPVFRGLHPRRLICAFVFCFLESIYSCYKGNYNFLDSLCS